MHQTCQELIKRQGNKPERTYIEIPPGTPVWVQHRQNATPATVISQCAPNSYWIVQENSAEQPKVYRCTRTMLKIRSTPTDSEQRAQAGQWSTESSDSKFHIPAIPDGNRNVRSENSQENYNSNSVQPPLPTLDLPESENFSEKREESQLAGSLCTNDTTLGQMHLMHQTHQCTNASQQEKTLESQPTNIVTFTCKDTISTWNSGLPVENVELLTLQLIISDMNGQQPKYAKF